MLPTYPCGSAMHTRLVPELLLLPTISMLIIIPTATPAGISSATITVLIEILQSTPMPIGSSTVNSITSIIVFLGWDFRKGGLNECCGRNRHVEHA